EGAVAKSYFRILGVPTWADHATVKKAYYALVKKYHPDANAHASEDERAHNNKKFREVQEAFDAICTQKGWK
ncbi:MAG: DnaJ domain-containing protein, partial [Chitinophagales bacterium]